MTMNKITPHLWFDKEAREAAGLYTSTFSAKDSRIKYTATIHDTPSGDADIVTIDLYGQEFTLLNAGPLFKFTPAVSFLVAFPTKEEVDACWARLAEGGRVLMELGEYPFSERYGWLQDRYGLSWQLSYAGGRDLGQRITPTLLFTGEKCGKAEEAIRFYASLFPDSGVGDILRYGPGEEPDRAGSARYAAFRLAGQEFRGHGQRPGSTASPSTRPSRSWCTAIPRKRSTATGGSSPRTRRPRRAAG